MAGQASHSREKSAKGIRKEKNVRKPLTGHITGQRPGGRWVVS